MVAVKHIRLNKVLKELNISMQTAADFFDERGLGIDARPNTKVDGDIYRLLLDAFQSDKSLAEQSEEISKAKKLEKEEMLAQRENPKVQAVIRGKAQPLTGPKILGDVDLDNLNRDGSTQGQKPKGKSQAAGMVQPVVEKGESKTVKSEPPPVAKTEPIAKPEREKGKGEGAAGAVLKTLYQKLDGPNFTGEKIDLSKFAKKPAEKTESKPAKPGKAKRKRIRKGESLDRSKKQARSTGASRKDRIVRTEPTEAEIQKRIKETLDKLTGKGGGKSRAYKFRREKRDARRLEQRERKMRDQERESKVLQVTEFVTVGELATLMGVPIVEVIATCMSLGIMVTMNQRLDAETLSIVADEFGFEVHFTTADLDGEDAVESDDPADLEPRPPIVTVMGHVDHGKTALLDCIRKSNVIAGEAGGITQHIAAYNVKLPDDQSITFLDTPGHEAFTAMRARGAQVTDIAIIVIAADDDVMPQTREAISHVQAARVPMVFAINKIDKPSANPDKVKETLANMNLLVADWGGKIQSQAVSAKTGQGVEDLLEKVLLEAELLDIKANPNKNAIGVVIEASLDKGRGYLATLLVQAGAIKVGDYLLAGCCAGKVKALLDERGKNVAAAGPSTPVVMLGLNGAPTAGDRFKVYADEREAKNIASQREQLQREQGVRTQKHITLDEIGRRIALGGFQELNMIIKGDVDGSVEALADSLQKLATEEIQIKIIHKGVGQITESDVLLASASNAIIVGFQVRPTGSARAVAERESIDIRTYAVIYDAIDAVRNTIAGMRAPQTKEEILGNGEIREIFKISRVGTIAGCMVLDGKIGKNASVRLIRDGVAVHDGKLASLKRFKEDVKEVVKGYECGLNIENFNDIKVGDRIEAYEEVALFTKRD
ncbi:MAG: translation initiation factor IF-2 [Flavobacteriales bacterium]